MPGRPACGRAAGWWRYVRWPWVTLRTHDQMIEDLLRTLRHRQGGHHPAFDDGTPRRVSLSPQQLLALALGALPQQVAIMVSGSKSASVEPLLQAVMV